MNTTITYKYNRQDFKVNVCYPITDNFHVSVNDVLCGCFRPKKIIENIDMVLQGCIKRYLAEKEIGL